MVNGQEVKVSALPSGALRIQDPREPISDGVIARRGTTFVEGTLRSQQQPFDVREFIQSGGSRIIPPSEFDLSDFIRRGGSTAPVPPTFQTPAQIPEPTQQPLPPVDRPPQLQPLQAQFATDISTQLAEEPERRRGGGIDKGSGEPVGPTPLQVGPIPEQDIGGARLGLFEAIVGVGRNIFQRFTRRPGTGPAFGQIIEPLDLTVAPKVTETAIELPSGEVLSGERLSEGQRRRLQESGFIERTGTFGEFQRERETQRERQLVSARGVAQQELESQFGELQAQVTSGALPLEVAQERGADIFKDVESRFQTRQQDIQASFKDIPGIREPQRAKGIRTALEIGAIATPIGAFTLAARSSRQDPITIDLSAPSIEAGLTQRPTFRTATFLGAGVLGAGGRLFQAGRDVTQVRLESAAQAIRERPIRTIGLQFREGGDILEASAFQARGASSLARGTIASRTQLQKDTFRTLGQTDTTIIAKEFFTGRPIIATEQRLFGARGVSLPAEGPITPSVSEVVSAPTARGFIFRDGRRITTQLDIRTTPTSVQRDLFGSLTQRRGDIIVGRGGRIDTIGADILARPGFAQFQGLRLSVPTEVESITRVIRRPSDLGITSFRGAGGRRTPFTTTTQDLAPSVSQQVTRQTFTETPKLAGVTRPSGSLVGIPRAVGGAGLTSTQIQRAQGSLVPIDIQPQIGLQVPTGRGLGLGAFQPLGIREQQITGPVQLGVTGLATRQFERTLPTVGQAPALAPALISSSLQAPALRERQLLRQTLIQETVTTPQTRRAPGPAGITGLRFGGFGLPFPSFGERPERRRRTRGRRARPIRISPSLTGVALEGLGGIVGGPLPTGTPSFGVLPGQARLVPRKKKKAKKKKK